MNSLSIRDTAIAIVVLLAVAGIVWYFAQWMGIVIPGIVVTIFWIVVIAVFVIAAINFVARSRSGP